MTLSIKHHGEKSNGKGIFAEAGEQLVDRELPVGDPCHRVSSVEHVHLLTLSPCGNS